VARSTGSAAGFRLRRVLNGKEKNVCIAFAMRYLHLLVDNGDFATGQIP